MEMTLHKYYKTLAHLILVKAKVLKMLSKHDYNCYVKPYCTILSNKPISETQLLTGIKRSRIEIVK